MQTPEIRTPLINRTLLYGPKSVRIYSNYCSLICRFGGVCSFLLLQCCLSLSVSIFTAHPLLFGFSLGRDTIHTIRELQGKHFGSKWVASALLHCLVSKGRRRGRARRYVGNITNC